MNRKNTGKSKIIAISNQKGGVGKTTTANAFASGLKKRGYAVLAIDLDPQSNLSSSVFAENDGDALTIDQVLENNCTALEAVQHMKDFDIIPSNILLAGYEQKLISIMYRENQLKKAIQPITDLYDYIIIDTAPSLGILTTNALVAADEVIVPLFAQKFAIDGLRQFVDTVQQIRNNVNDSKLHIVGALVGNYDARRNLEKNVSSGLSSLEAIGISTFKTHIRVCSKVPECQVQGTCIYDYDKTKENHASIDFNNFVDEYLAKEQE